MISLILSIIKQSQRVHWGKELNDDKQSQEQTNKATDAETINLWTQIEREEVDAAKAVYLDWWGQKWMADKMAKQPLSDDMSAQERQAYDKYLLPVYKHQEEVMKEFDVLTDDTPETIPELKAHQEKFRDFLKNTYRPSVKAHQPAILAMFGELKQLGLLPSKRVMKMIQDILTQETEFASAELKRKNKTLIVQTKAAQARMAQINGTVNDKG